jgi:hypothetical protein
MIVVVGSPAWRLTQPARPAGRACVIALTAASSGSPVELVGRTGDDAASDALVLALSRSGVGHVALLRDPARPTRVLAAGADEDGGGDEDAEGAREDDAAAPVMAPESSASPALAAPPGPELEPADVSLGLQYLAAYRVLVVSDDAPSAVIPACVEAARFTGAHLVLALPAPDAAGFDAPADATVLLAPEVGGDAFARMLGLFAAALDRGEAPGEALATATRDAGWESTASEVSSEVS